MLNAMSEDSKVSRDLKPSPELFEMIQAAASSLTGFAQLWESIRKKGNSEGFTDEQLQWLLRPLLKDKLGMSKDKIYYLFHKEEKAEYNKEAYDKRRINLEIDKKKELEQTDEEPTREELEEIKRAQQQPQEQPVTDISIKAENLYSEGQDFFTVMKKRADGIHSFYYDAYGIDLFRNRELAQLKNSGVKVFRRLYFEV